MQARTTTAEQATRCIGGRYRVDALLGEGGMGAVYRVWDEGDDRPLALKCLRPGAHTKEAELFEREYRTLAGLRHPCIVRVFDYGRDDGSSYYTMELLEGGDLSHRAPMGWKETCACLRDAASILGVLHARQLLHRDLSARNLWLTPEGRLKLLDFGALARFGPATEVVGTPPFIAPELLNLERLDQRTDLFALGALGHWLLTGTHAYRARQLHELREAWSREPAPPSSLAKLVDGGDQDVPEALDRLIQSLLRLDPDERPRTTTEVIDCLDSLAGLKPESQDVIVQGYLESNAFVGRTRERTRFAKVLSRTQLRRPQSVCVTGPEGIGRSRLLQELEMAAHLAGSTVLSVSARSGGYATALALSRELLRALPREAPALAEPFAEWLGALSPALHRALGAPSAPAPVPTDNPMEGRTRKQAALEGWFLAASELRSLVLVVDDLHLADEESQALLASLARTDQPRQLLLLCGVRSDAPEAAQSALRGFTSVSHAWRLAPLSVEELHTMLRSVFGEVAYLERLAVRLHALSGGSPKHVELLVRHLVRSGSARYADGTWALPHELPEDLPSTLAASLVDALDSLPATERQVARIVSLSQFGPLSRATVRATVELPPDQVDVALDALVDKALLKESEAGVALAQPSLQRALHEGFEEAARKAAHLRLAQQLAGHDDLPVRVRSALHRMHAGHFSEAEACLHDCSLHILVDGGHAYLPTVGPMFREALTLQNAAGRDAHSRAPMLAILGVTSWHVDRVYAVQFVDEIIDTLEEVLRFDLARRLRPYLGGKLSLIVALVWAGFASRTREAGYKIPEVVAWLVMSVTAMAGAFAVSLDGTSTRRCAEALQPLRALGKDHAANLLYHDIIAYAGSLDAEHAPAQRTFTEVIARLHDPTPIEGLPDPHRPPFLTGATFGWGIQAYFACDRAALDTAETLDGFGSLGTTQAAQLRSLYYALMGQPEEAALHQQKLERLAVQQGATWQVELWAPANFIFLALWTHDAAAAKRAYGEFSRQIAEVPSVAVLARIARATHRLLRGRASEALELLTEPEIPPNTALRGLPQALIAAAHSALGDHAEAKRVCEQALARLPEAELAYVTTSLDLRLQLALARARLGEIEEARRALEELLEQNADKGPLVLGHVHDALFQVALQEDDYETCEAHVEAMQQLYKPTRMAALLERASQRRREYRRAQNPEAEDQQLLSADDAHIVTRLQLMMSSSQSVTQERTSAAMRVVLDITAADRCFAVGGAEGTLRLCVGEEEPSDARIEWARQQLEAASAEEQTALLSPQFDTATSQLDDPHVRSFGPLHCRLMLLYDGLGRAAAALVLGSLTGTPRPAPHAVLDVVRGHLLRTATEPAETQQA